jgi:Helix-turn-helix domain of resolvase
MLPGKKRMGRPRAVGPAKLRQMVDGGISVTEAARTLKISRSTAYNALSADLPGNEGQGERQDHELTAEQPGQDVDRDELFDVIEDLLELTRGGGLHGELAAALAEPAAELSRVMDGQDGNGSLGKLTAVCWGLVDAVQDYRQAPGTPPRLVGLTDRLAAVLPARTVNRVGG